MVANCTSTFLPVLAYPVTFPVNAPEKVVAVTVPVEGVTKTVLTAETAAPATEVLCGINVI